MSLLGLYFLASHWGIVPASCMLSPVHKSAAFCHILPHITVFSPGLPDPAWKRTGEFSLQAVGGGRGFGEEAHHPGLCPSSAVCGTYLGEGSTSSVLQCTRQHTEFQPFCDSFLFPEASSQQLMLLHKTVMVIHLLNV